MAKNYEKMIVPKHHINVANCEPLLGNSKLLTDLLVKEDSIKGKSINVKRAITLALIHLNELQRKLTNSSMQITLTSYFSKQ